MHRYSLISFFYCILFWFFLLVCLFFFFFNSLTVFEAVVFLLPTSPFFPGACVLTWFGWGWLASFYYMKDILVSPAVLRVHSWERGTRRLGCTFACTCGAHLLVNFLDWSGNCPAKAKEPVTSSEPPPLSKFLLADMMFPNVSWVFLRHPLSADSWLCPCLI